MTDEQWLWLFANQNLDADEKLEAMCPDCRREVTQEKHCIRCGKKIADIGSDINEGFESYTSKTFDIEKYEALKNGTYKLDMEKEEDNNNEVEDIDFDLVGQLMNGGE